MHHVYGVTGEAFYVFDIYHDLVEKRIYVEFSLHNSTLYYKNTFNFRGISPRTLKPGALPFDLTEDKAPRPPL